MTFATEPDVREALRKPFPKEFIEKLPASAGRPALDFINHAIVTDRLNEVVPDATWTVDEQWDITKHYVDKKSGELKDKFEFWVRGTMTIGGVSRVEYGDGDDPKDAIGNFVKRAAMRFGVGIDLWIRNEAAQQKSEAKSEAAYGEGATSDGGPEGDGKSSSGPPDLDEEAKRDFRLYLKDTYGTAQALMMARELYQTKARKVGNLTVLDLPELEAVDTEFKERKVTG